ncbi:UNVERIFIED_ORG: hypothetical protein L601_001100000110 [Gordonia westfalica J30]
MPTGRRDSLGGNADGVGPRRLPQFTVPVADQWRGQAVGLGRVRESPPPLVTVPLGIDLGVVPGEASEHFAAPMVGALGASARTVLTDARRRDEIERPCTETILGTGQRADRTDLDGVAGEVRVERFVLIDADLLQRTTICQLDERIAGDLRGEARAPGTEDASLAVEQNLRRQRDRLGERAFDAVEPGLAATGRHGLVLQRALTALVAHRTVERMVDQQQLHHAALRIRGDLRTELGPDHHPVGGRGGARRQGLPLALDLHEALAAGADRVEQRVIAEARDGDPDLLGGADQQGALRHPQLDAVDGDAHEIVGLGRRITAVGEGHRASPVGSEPRTVDSEWSNGQP